MRYIFLFLSILTFSQQTKSVDFISCEALLFPDAKTKSISGTVHYLFEIKNNIDSVKIDAKNMIFSAIYINDNTKFKYKLTNDQIILYDGLKKGLNGITIKYEAKPKQTLYFTGERENLQIWTQGQGKYTSHWLPSFDDVNEKVIFKLGVYFDQKHHVLSNGKLINKINPK
ncbi:MAG: M1 family peptidase, partial [Flavobacterium sp.]